MRAVGTAVALLLAGCAAADTQTSPAPTVDSTPSAFAAAGLAHLQADLGDSLEIRAIEGRDRPQDSDEGFPLEAEYALTVDGTELHVEVSTGPPSLFKEFTQPCTEVGADRCDVEDLDGGGRRTVVWTRASPEEDPGSVFVLVVRAAAAVLVSESGPPITEVPMDLPVPVETLAAIASDPVVGPRTSPEMIAAGDDVPEYQTPPRSATPKALAAAVSSHLGDVDVRSVVGGPDGDAGETVGVRVVLELDDPEPVSLDVTAGYVDYLGNRSVCREHFPDATACRVRAVDAYRTSIVVWQRANGADPGYLLVGISDPTTGDVLVRETGPVITEVGQDMPYDVDALLALAADDAIESSVEEQVNDAAADFGPFEATRWR